MNTPKHRIVIAGCGNMANEWVKYAISRDDCEIAGLMDINMESAIAMAGRHGLKSAAYDNLEDAIRETHASLVFDITVPEAHRYIVTTALKSGCNVFGEKPMASSMEDALEMVKTANETGKTYAVMQNRRFLKKSRDLKNIVSSGMIGKPSFICADYFMGPHSGSFQEQIDHPLIREMAIHTFDQARFYTDNDPVSVYCHEFNPENSWFKGNASAICIFEYSDGSVFCYRGSFCAEGCITTWESSWRIVAGKGTAIWDGSGAPYCEVLVPSSGQEFIRSTERIAPASDWGGREGHFGCLDEMFTAINENRKSETDCTDNIKSVAMVYGAIKSAKEGKKIALEY